MGGTQAIRRSVKPRLAARQKSHLDREAKLPPPSTPDQTRSTTSTTSFGRGRRTRHLTLSIRKHVFSRLLAAGTAYLSPSPVEGSASPLRPDPMRDTDGGSSLPLVTLLPAFTPSGSWGSTWFRTVRFRTVRRAPRWQPGCCRRSGCEGSAFSVEFCDLLRQLGWDFQRGGLVSRSQSLSSRGHFSRSDSSRSDTSRSRRCWIWIGVWVALSSVGVGASPAVGQTVDLNYRLHYFNPAIVESGSTFPVGVLLDIESGAPMVSGLSLGVCHDALHLHRSPPSPGRFLRRRRTEPP